MYLKTTQITKTKKKKKSGSERKALIKTLDQLVRDILKTYPQKCCCCGKTEGLTVGHYVTRRVYALRWDLRNCNLQCYGCNLRHNYDPIPYTLFMLKEYGKEVLDSLTFKRNTVDKLTTMRLTEMVTELQLVKGT